MFADEYPLAVEHHVLVEPHEVPGGAGACHPSYVQGLLGRFFGDECRQHRAVIGELWTFFAAER